jgi:hypothetical protein
MRIIKGSEEESDNEVFSMNPDSNASEHRTAYEIERGIRSARLGRWTRSEHIRFI